MDGLFIVMLYRNLPKGTMDVEEGLQIMLQGVSKQIMRSCRVYSIKLVMELSRG